ncbi:hypothetical protein HN51_037247 [Arachis hypogaea]|uniref:Uncharacterized protein n=1 Tax=Arachis hypogaea TaxID=3818 RepID=A0A444ZWJ3_ARAHY|nr:uncharacterized protein LOC107631222 [Arachis ipaensis]XP_025638257.1 uncharacterized protein LOC112733503 [Arachis hypogaea]QHO02780.1 uncharacterized protein DS421_13g426690 [Arachis hypogaea]RYR18583.1 hypothetical protein Ahy_B03g063210 [Arachis hypogaea]
MGATSMVRGGGTRFLPLGLISMEPLSPGCDSSSRVNSSSYAQKPSDQDINATRFGDVEFEFLGDISLLDNNGHHDDDLCHRHNNDPMQFDDDDEEEEDGDSNNNNGDANESITFWQNQYQLLQANIQRTSSLESRIRNEAKEAVEELRRSPEMVCSCSGSGRQVDASSCRNCLMRQVSRRLQGAGFDSAICKTKWRTSPNLPAGEHTFVDVIDNTSSKRGDIIRVIIEVNFRAEFEMAKTCEEYNRLVQRLPEVFVGKVERLNNIIKVLCMGAKRCMKENKMHMGPWRKQRYMSAKWLGPCDRNTSTTPLSMGHSQSKRMPKPKAKASMLTVDLHHLTPAVKVL